MNTLKILLMVVSYFLLFASNCYADAGIPMFIVEVPIILTALIPIIITEIIVFSMTIKSNYKQIILGVSYANILSTLAGYPLTWFLRLILEMGVNIILLLLYIVGLDKIINLDFISNLLFSIFGASWLGEISEKFYWSIPVSALFGLIPAFFVSIYIEHKTIKRFIKEDNPELKYLVIKANIISYILLGMFVFIYLFNKASNQ